MALKLKFNPSEPGIWISGITHVLVLVVAAILLLWSPVSPFPDAEEGIPVEVVTDNMVSQITKGEKDAKTVQPTPKPRVDRVSEKTEQNAPGEDKVNAPAPPKRPDDMRVADEEKAAAAAAAAAARAAEQKAAQAKAEEEKKAAEKAEAEAIEKAKIEQAKAEAEARAKAEAKAKAEAEAKRVAEEKAAKAKAEAEAKAKAEAEAKRIADAKAKAEAEEKARKDAQVAKKLDMGDLKQFLDNKDKSKSTGSTGAEVTKQASLGTQTGTAAKLNPSMRDGLIGLLQDQMRQCYTAPLTTFKPPLIDIRLNQDGTLSSPPVIVSAGSTSADQAAAEAAVRAVKRCAPYRIPAQYAPYYNDWKYLSVGFDAA